MRTLVLAFAFAITVTGCGSSREGSSCPPNCGEVDALPSGDAPLGCYLTITLDPGAPATDPVAPIRATATAYNAPGVLTYTWTLTLDGNDHGFDFAQIDHSQIDFVAADVGLYDIRVAIDGSSGCLPADDPVTINAPGAPVADYRLQFVTDPTLAPPQDLIVQMMGGGDIQRAISLDPGSEQPLLVSDGTTGIPAYVRFIPAGHPSSYVEAFSTTTGSLDVRTLLLDHDVLVVPATPGLAPALLPFTPNVTSALVVGPGTTVTGTVKDPAGAVLAGAKVQLTSADGVPSTLATTNASGAFTLHASFAPGAAITADVTPPPGRGLPALTAKGAFDLGSTMQITYAATLATCDLVGTPVRRNAIAQPGAQVTVVGTLAGSAGTIATGTVSRPATGAARIAAVADATGKLPAMLVPRAALSAVVELGGGDVALSAINTSTCPAQTLSTPAMTVASGVVQSAMASALRGVAIEATPVGALAGLPPVQTTSNASGAFSLALATGGHYDVRFVDPSGIGAPLILLGATTATIPATASLPAAIHIKGSVGVSGNANPVIGASVQALCATCTGIDATRPLAQGATDSASQFLLAVPDPGTM